MNQDVEAYAREKGISVTAAQKQLESKKKATVKQSAKLEVAKPVEPPAEEVKELDTNGEE